MQGAPPVNIKRLETEEKNAGKERKRKKEIKRTFRKVCRD